MTSEQLEGMRPSRTGSNRQAPPFLHLKGGRGEDGTDRGEGGGHLREEILGSSTLKASVSP